jgi:hypothetical protein
MQIFLKYDRTVTLDVDPQEKIGSVRMKYMYKVKCAYGYPKFFYSGKILADNDKLISDFHVTRESTIMVLVSHYQPSWFGQARIDSLELSEKEFLAKYETILDRFN